MVGHCLGTAGAIEAAALALTIERGVIPPTIHHGATDPECEVDVVANDAREVDGALRASRRRSRSAATIPRSSCGRCRRATHRER